MAKREHRLHHWLWHEVRNSWNSYPADIQKESRTSAGNLRDLRSTRRVSQT